jgi:hypothetical protein
MKTYEPFKSQAQRLISITCDRCGEETWNVAYQRGGTARLNGIDSGRSYFHVDYDLCPTCLETLAEVVEVWVSGTPGGGGIS